MSQSYVVVADTDTLALSRSYINNNYDALLTEFSGTSFPTLNIKVGMNCYRSDLNKTYKLTSVAPSSVWTLITDLGQVQIGRDDADARYFQKNTSAKANVVLTGIGATTSDWVGIQFQDNAGNQRWYIWKDQSQDLKISRYDQTGTYVDTPFSIVSGVPQIGTNKIWHAGNDGAASGLDADLVRGVTPGYIGAAVLAAATQGDAQSAIGVAPATTGSIMLMFAGPTFTIAGYVPMNGQTIGAAGSGATARANSDCLALYTHLWTNSSLAVTGGRGASASADWNALKPIALPDSRGRTMVVFDNMGGTTSANRVPNSVVASGDSSTVGSYGGSATITLDASQMPSHSHTINDPGHKHTVPFVYSVTPGGNFPAAANQNTTDTSTSTTGITINNTGGGGAHGNMQPFMMVGAYIKL